ncbi:von willebrand factor [Pleurostoma richardsiae]|uniref:von willebrand factor n=1 Tax=Pleurostoma richardsiae TaxID=41990 RepID=A0AA38R3P9_9PEZI|nr:von willebrand factor [Pleurostoma richardsiae]
MSGSKAPSSIWRRGSSRSPSTSGPGGTSSATSPISPTQNPFGIASPVTRRPFRDPPPAYSETPTAESGPAIPTLAVGGPAPGQRAASPSPSLFSISTPEDPYAFLSVFDTVFVIDDSYSMRGRSWDEVRACLAAIVPICAAHDEDGLDVYFLNHRSIAGINAPAGKATGGYYNVVSADTVERIFTTVRPRNYTPTGTRLHHVLYAYMRRYEAAVRAAGGDTDGADVAGIKPINVIVVTDGVPSDDPQSIIAAVARRLDKLDAPPHQIGVQFFQVGNEPGAAEALRELDDALAEEQGVRDMVDTVTFNAADAGGVPTLTADAVLKTVLGAVHKKHDQKRLSAEGDGSS